MNKINKTSRIIAGLMMGILMIFSSCEHRMAMETVVHENGALDKTIRFSNTDSSLATQNIFGVNAKHGWTVDLKKNDDDTSRRNEEFNIEFRKHFNSSEEMNIELNNEADSLFQIKSTFEKKFKWFYTYIKYTETYSPINRFKTLPITDYINQEDFQFIERLPAEDSVISKANNIYLDDLNKKICDTYGELALFHDWYDDILIKIITKSSPDKKWIDTIKLKRKFIFEMLHSEEKKHSAILLEQSNKYIVNPSVVIKIADTLGIPLQGKVIEDINDLSKNLNRRVNFMNFAKDGKFKNVIEIPWSIVTSNADSIGGNRLYWNPRVTKFLASEYVMYAESRKLNLWTVVVSGAILLLTLYVLVRRWKR